MADKAARDHVFPILVKELVKEEIGRRRRRHAAQDVHGRLARHSRSPGRVRPRPEMGELVDTLEGCALREAIGKKKAEAGRPHLP